MFPVPERTNRLHLLSGFAHNRLPCCGDLVFPPFDGVRLPTLLMALSSFSHTEELGSQKFPYSRPTYSTQKGCHSLYIFLYVHSFALASELSYFVWQSLSYSHLSEIYSYLLVFISFSNKNIYWSPVLSRYPQNPEMLVTQFLPSQSRETDLWTSNRYSPLNMKTDV